MNRGPDYILDWASPEDWAACETLAILCVNEAAAAEGALTVRRSGMLPDPKHWPPRFGIIANRLEAGPPLGFISFEMFTVDEYNIRSRFNVGMLCVAPENRRRGIGRHLVRRAMDIAREEKAEIITLTVADANKAALCLYDSLGFVGIDRQMGLALPGIGAVDTEPVGGGKEFMP